MHFLSGQLGALDSEGYHFESVNIIFLPFYNNFFQMKQLSLCPKFDTREPPYLMDYTKYKEFTKKS